MRNLFLVLLLANLAFAAWHAWFAQPARPTHVADADLPSITLVSELPDDVAALSGAGQLANAPREEGVVEAASKRDAGAASNEPSASVGSGSGESPLGEPADEVPIPAAAAPTRPETTAATAPARSGVVADSPRCTSVGPFRELSQAATAAATLRTAGYQPTQRVSEGDIWIGYWVYIEAIPTTALANEILTKLRAEGVTDSYVIPNTDSGNLVSLGVFSEISGVSRRREQVRALGYEPNVVDRTRRATVYWVDVVLTRGQVLDFDALQTPGRIIRLEQRACGAPAA